MGSLIRVIKIAFVVVGSCAATCSGCSTPPPQSASETQSDRPPPAQTQPDGICDEWPAGTTAQEIGKRVAENFVARPLGNGEMHYAEACAWYGALSVSSLLDDDDLTHRLIRRFDPMLTREGAHLIPSRGHVDDRVFGIAPLEIARHHDDGRYLKLGLSMADAQWSDTTSDGITSEARYWIDDMYMITALQVQAYRVTGKTQYLDRAALTMAAYLQRLQQPNGLFFHTAASPVHWGRGDGWVAAGMTELMLDLPDDHPHHQVVADGYAKMMAALLQHQGTDGLWRQIIDDPTSWPETSSSAMFTFAMVAGVKGGALNAETFREPACRAWQGVIGYLNDDAELREVCVGTGDADSQGFDASDPAAQRQYYLDRPRHTGDFHGQAPVLWAAAALLR